ncbi:hypothetical protein [Streptomyces himalayensis]|uniref:Uncharacterized protein n=1 Tax=Streptomyces himalayensis subsp. himalayensis TaxID=2756131 RepID=A0A7W0IAZ8_9ACTN|nr:hypothetical protein [Streptomyces himalayensis]MBA2948634.1 hypothetical protein [Streptomyces himalayensis subsp. himalayensis]
MARFAPPLADAGDERRLLLDGTFIRTRRCAALATADNGDPLCTPSSTA